MSTLSLELCVVLTHLPEDLVLGRVLLFPELARLAPAEGLEALVKDLEVQVRTLSERDPLRDFDRRVLSSQPRLTRVAVTWEPDPRNPRWRAPIQLELSALCWEHAGTSLAYLPALGIEVFARDEEQLGERIERHAKQAVARASGAYQPAEFGQSGSGADLPPDLVLQELARADRERRVELRSLSLEIELKSPRRVAQDAARPEDKPVLAEVCDDLTQDPQPAYRIEAALARVAEILTGRHPKSVLLVGPPGVGKTALVYELVRQRATLGLGQAPVWSTSGARLVAGMSGFGEWQARCGRLWREASKERAILHLGNLLELNEVGRSVLNAQGVASFFRPYLVRGDLLAIAELTPEQRRLLEHRDPHLLEAFVQVDLSQPEPADLREILRLRAESEGERVHVEPEALAAIERLHLRYASYSANPGRPLGFLQRALQERRRARRHGEASEVRLAPAHVLSGFAQETGLPGFLIDDEVLLDLRESSQWFTARVRGQEAATRRIVDLLATLKAALARPRQPLASLLFMGPTGVGKTESAKALAEFLFGDPRRLTRFDMSEYQSPAAVARLVGGGPGGEGLLTGKVREQPFSVVLLDEVEKACASLFDLLLQVLGEGRLTDAQGRVADFTNAVVIMTSNLGAERFGRGVVGFGDQDEALEADEHFTDALRSFLRPELFNRIDRVIPFLALAPATVSEIARARVEGLHDRPGLRFRDVSLEVSEAALERLSERGYDPRYGARPLLRALNRELAVPLAEALNRYGEDLPLAAVAEPGPLGLAVKVRPRPRSDALEALTLTRAGQAQAAAALRRRLQLLEKSPVTLGLRNEVFRLGRLEERWKKKRRGPYPQALGILPKLRGVTSSIDELSARVVGLEEELCLRIMAREVELREEVPALLEEAVSDWRLLLISLYCLRDPHTERALVVVFGDTPTWRAQIARGYLRLGSAHGLKVTLTPLRYGVPPREVVTPATPEELREAEVSRERARVVVSASRSSISHADPQVYADPLSAPDPFAELVLSDSSEAEESPRAAIGYALWFEGPLAWPLLRHEEGLHVRRSAGTRQRALVETSSLKLEGYEAPLAVHRRDYLGTQSKRRLYDLTKGRIDDTFLEVSEHWPLPDVEGALADYVERGFQRALEGLVIDDPVPPRTSSNRGGD